MYIYVLNLNYSIVSLKNSLSSVGVIFVLNDAFLFQLFKSVEVSIE